MQGIYNYTSMPETNHDSTVCSFATVLYLQSALHVMLFTVCATCTVIYSLRYMYCYLQSALHVMLFTVCATCNVIYSLRYM